MKELLGYVILAVAVLESEKKLVLSADDFFTMSLLFSNPRYIRTFFTACTVQLDWNEFLELANVLQASRASTTIAYQRHSFVKFFAMKIVIFVKAGVLFPIIITLILVRVGKVGLV
jgi:hypothetical protein